MPIAFFLIQARSTPSAAPPSSGGIISAGAGGSSGDISDDSSGDGGVRGAPTQLGPGCRPHAELLELKRLLLLLLLLLMWVLLVVLDAEGGRGCVRICLTWGGGGSA